MPDPSQIGGLLSIRDKYRVYGMPALVIAFMLAYNKPLIAAMGSFSRDLQIEALDRNTAQFMENNRLFHGLFIPVNSLLDTMRDVHAEQKIQTDQLRAISSMININSEILRGFRK